jgi:riboflavin synthase
MFTGLVQTVGVVVEVSKGSGLRLGLTARDWDYQPEPGASICVSGVCLTMAKPLGTGVMAFDVVEETLSKTTLGGLRMGSRVNLERSLAAGDLMGGHVVQGHVDGVGTVERIQTGADYRVWVRPAPGLMEFIIPKGSITLDGASLTVASADPKAGLFEVALIPTTLAKTTLGQTRTGDRCNLETDIMARTVVHYLRHYAAARA